MMSNDHTSNLASAASRGDRGKFGELYERVAPALYAWASVRIRAQFRRAISPEDLVQEVWLRASTIFASYDPDKTNFRAWIFSVAKNVLFEVQRRLYKHSVEKPAEGHTDRLFVLDQIPEDVTSITQRIQRDEGVGAFIARIGQLEDLDRKVMIHCGLEGLTIRETAERLGVNQEAIGKRWQRLRDRVREWRIPRELVLEA